MNIPAPFKSIIYDLDGTLLDTFPTLLTSLRSVAGSLHDRFDIPSLRLSLSAGIPAILAEANVQLGLPEDDRSGFSIRVLQHYERHGLENSLPYAGVAEHLSALGGLGITQGLCTNRDPSTTRALLQQHGLSTHFQHIVCLGDVPQAKPDPAPLLHCIARLGAHPAATLFVGDSRVDAECARQAEVAFAAHCRGYHGSPADLFPHAVAFSEWHELTGQLTRHIASIEVAHA